MPLRNTSLHQWGRSGSAGLLLSAVNTVWAAGSSFLLCVCLAQVCSGSICEKHSLDVCTCASQEGKDEAAELCHVCCMKKGERRFISLIRSSESQWLFHFLLLLSWGWSPESVSVCQRSLPLPSGDPSSCSSTGSEKWAQFFNKKITTLQPGSPCNDFKGYCDVFMRCRLVDADGPLARLKKAIFNAELYENIAEWIMVSAPPQIQETQ